MTARVSNSGIAYDAKGSGPAVIFLHGWSMAGSVWDRQLNHFSHAGFEAVAIDLRGHGESIQEGPYTISQMAFDLKSFIHEMEYEKPFLVGWSMGAMVLLDFIAKHPSAASAFCLIGGTPRFTAADDFPHGLPVKDVKGMKVKLKRDFGRCLRGFRESITGGLDEAEKRIIEDAVFPVYDAAKNGIKELLEADLRDRLDQIRASLLLIHGDEDRVCPPGASRFMAERVGGAEICEIKGAGHVPFLSHREEVNKKLEEFIRSH